MPKLTASRPSDLKYENRAAILKYVYHRSITSKPDICKSLGMSKPTVSTLIDELVSENILSILGRGSSTTQGGKRPLLYTFNATAGLVIALHVGVEKIRGALIDLKTDLHSRIELSLRHTQVEDTLAAIYSVVNRLISHAKALETPILGIGVSAPGVVESQKGILVRAIHLEGWTEVPIGPRLESEFHLPVWVDNESRNTAMAEKWFGVGKNLNAFITVQTRDGIGTGIIQDGSTYRGLDSSAGEFGHTTIDMNGPLCRCGNRGCWELYASEHALLASTATNLTSHPTSLLAKRINTGEELTVQMMGDAYLEGDEFTVEQVTIYASRLAIGLVNLVNAFNPEAIILHDNLPVFGPPFLDLLSSIVRKSALRSAANRVTIQYSEFLQDTVIIGAASLVIKEIVEGRLLWNRAN